jgi:hypothetical protein
MHKPLLLAVAFICGCLSHAQKTDTLVLFYKTDQYTISKESRQKLDKFLLSGWNRIFINGYTDEMDGEDYNLTLSKKRSGEVRQYINQKKFPDSLVTEKYFGEAMPFADNETEDGRALNRRTEIIGYRFPRITLKPKEDPMKEVTTTLDNGFIISYRPGALPGYLAANFASGSGIDFQFITNTTEMRQNDFYNNTTNGEILSSVLIICSGQISPCKLDAPVLLRVPFPYNTQCPLNTIKFFNSYVNDGKKIWEEQKKQVKIETIQGRKYMAVWVDNFCGCVNFDIKIPECYEVDSAYLYVKKGFKNISAELSGLNSVYIPEKINDSTHSIVYEKNKLSYSTISFKLLNGKKTIRSFWNQQLSTLPFDEITKQYQLSAGSIKFSFPDVKIHQVNLKVNKDKYMVYPVDSACEFTYLNRKAEKILVDFIVIGRKNRAEIFRNQPLESIPFDELTGQRIIDKEFIKQLRIKTTVAGL